MITEISLQDWKSYKASTLCLDPVTILIGTNASGKSNALDALAFLNRIANGAMLTAALQGDGALTPLRGGVEWSARRPGKTFSIGVTCKADEDTDYTYRIECTVSDNRCDLSGEYLTRKKFSLGKDGLRRTPLGDGIKIYRTDPCQAGDPTIVARLYNEKQGTRRELPRTQSILSQLFGQKLRQEISDGIQCVASALREIFILDPIPSHMRAYSPLAEKLEPDAKNIAGVIAALDPTDQTEIEKTLTQYASRLPERDIVRVYAEPVGKFNSDAMLYCEEHWVDEGLPPVVDARGMSDGTLRLLAILTALLTRPKNSLLVIEEVDNGLHPSRANMLLDMLQTVGANRGVDVLATTHNPALLDAMGAKMVPFITIAHRDSEGHSALTLLENLKDLPKLLAQGSIGKLSSRGLFERSLQRRLDFDFDINSQ